MVLLCAGVLIIGATYHAVADSFDVTASVQAPLPTSSADITVPYNDQHVSVASLTVIGTCPAQSYVKLYNGTNFSGVSICSNNAFQIVTSLDQGANMLQARVFNVTDQEGPQSPTITVNYDVTTTPLPDAPSPAVRLPSATAPLGVLNVESGTYHQGQVIDASTNPTITGWAVPYADIVVTFHSVVETCKTTSNAQGWWSCTLDHLLPVGQHEVDIAATSPNGQLFSLPTFHILVLASLASIARPDGSVESFDVLADYQHQAYLAGHQGSIVFGFRGGTAPYAVTIDWGDGHTTTALRQDKVLATAAHTYMTAQVYTIQINAIDAKGVKTSMQMIAYVRSVGTAAATVPKGPLATTISWASHWLWIVWPVYGLVVLMVLSYWIGEQEAYQRLLARRRAATSGRTGRTK